MGLSEDAKFAGKMLQKSAKAEGAKIGVILSILPFGSRPWSKLSWELHCLTFDGTNGSALKESWESVYPVCMAYGTEDWMIYQQIGKPSYWPVYRSFRQCVLSETELVWNERVKAASLDVIVFFFQEVSYCKPHLVNIVLHLD